MAITTTTLAAACGVSDLVLVLTSATGTATGNTIQIGGEYLSQTGDAVGVIIPVSRGRNGSAQIAHAAATSVRMGLPSDFNLVEPTQAGVYTDTTLTGDGSSARPLSAVNTGDVSLAGNNDFTGNNSFAGSTTFKGTAPAIRTDTTTAHTFVVQAYDVDGTAYKTFITATNGNTPDLTIAPPTGSTLVVQATTFKSSDGSSGATAGPFTTISSITVKNGLVTALTGS